MNNITLRDETRCECVHKFITHIPKECADFIKFPRPGGERTLKNVHCYKTKRELVYKHHYAPLKTNQCNIHLIINRVLFASSHCIFDYDKMVCSILEKSNVDLMKY